MHTAQPHRLRLVRDAKGTHRVQFYIGQRRYRYAHGKAIGCPLRPNTYPEPITDTQPDNASSHGQPYRRTKCSRALNHTGRHRVRGLG